MALSLALPCAAGISLSGQAEEATSGNKTTLEKRLEGQHENVVVSVT